MSYCSWKEINLVPKPTRVSLWHGPCSNEMRMKRLKSSQLSCQVSNNCYLFCIFLFLSLSIFLFLSLSIFLFLSFLHFMIYNYFSWGCRARLKHINRENCQWILYCLLKCSLLNHKKPNNSFIRNNQPPESFKSRSVPWLVGFGFCRFNVYIFLAPIGSSLLRSRTDAEWNILEKDNVSLQVSPHNVISLMNCSILLSIPVFLDICLQFFFSFLLFWFVNL